MRRFINADGYASTGQGFGGYNMFAYCQNNPVMFVDPSGGLPKLFENLYVTFIEPISNLVKNVVKNWQKLESISSVY